jgi:hypothetical protein
MSHIRFTDEESGKWIAAINPGDHEHIADPVVLFGRPYETPSGYDVVDVRIEVYLRRKAS